MEVVLGMMAVLGRILLALFGLLCLLLFCILFYPIKYQVRGEFHGNIMVQGRIQWFWFLAGIPFCYQDNAFHWSIRIFGLDLMKFLDKRQDRKGQRRKTEKAVEKNAKEKETERKSALQGGGKDGKDKERKSQSNLRNAFADIKRIYRNFRKKTDYAGEMLSLLREENSRTLICIIKDNVLHLWRKLKPKVLRGHLVFGTGDPASTGEILGLFAVLYPWYKGGVQIIPDFQQRLLQGEVFIRGRISIVTFLWVLRGVFLSDEWTQFKKSYDKISTGCLS